MSLNVAHIEASPSTAPLHGQLARQVCDPFQGQPLPQLLESHSEDMLRLTRERMQKYSAVLVPSKGYIDVSMVCGPLAMRQVHAWFQLCCIICMVMPYRSTWASVSMMAMDDEIVLL